jgi:hypothetical protein
MNNTKFHINTIKLKKSIDAITLVIEDSFIGMQSSLDVMKKLFYKEDDWFATKEYLDSLSLKELKVFVFSNDNFNSDFHIQLFNYYINRTLFELSKKSFKTLCGVLKNINNLRKRSLQNKRDQIRKIYSFNFKNLDDTHSVIVFN